MFDKAKDMYKLQKQAKQVKKELKNIHIEAEVEGVIVVVDGEQTVQSVSFPENLSDKKKLENSTVKAFNKAKEKSQQIAAEKMKAIMGNMGLPGLG